MLVERTTRVLFLPSLSLSDVGNYTCEVSASSRILGRPIVKKSQPHSVILKGEDTAHLHIVLTFDKAGFIISVELYT